MRVQDKSEARKPIPAGNYYGVVVGIYDIGTQTGGQYGDKHKVVMQFELHKKKGICRGDDNKPLTTSKFYSLSFGKNNSGVKSALRNDVESILGRTFSDDEAKAGIDLFDLADKPCRISIKHEAKKNGDGVYEVATITTIDEDDPRLESELDTVLYDMDADGFDFKDEVPPWIQNLVKKSKEWASKSGAKQPAAVGAGAGHDDDDPAY
jgi:hypothetical protein